MQLSSMIKKLAAVGAFLLLSSGCASSTAGPGAGAAEGIVKGSVNHVNNQARAVFQQMNIQETGSSVKNSGSERQITGHLGDSDIIVTMDNGVNSTTNVKVDASKNAFSGKQDLAKEILNRIVQQA